MPRREPKGVIYFMRIADNGPIKIGFTTNLEKRTAALRCSCPYEVDIIGTVHGTRGTERALHAMFKSHRIRLEWFKHASVLLEWISANNGSDATGLQTGVAETKGAVLLRAAAERAGSQLALAERLGVSESLLSYWIAGKRTPGRSNALLLSTVCRIPFGAWEEKADVA